MSGNRWGRRYYVDGIQYKSGLEADLALYLIKNGVKFSYEEQKFPYHVDVPGTYCKECGSRPAYKQRLYEPDFFLENGIIIETKGAFDSADRKKHVAMKEQWPKLDIRLVFARDNWITKRRKAKYSDWCKGKGIPYHVGITLPKYWLEVQGGQN